LTAAEYGLGEFHVATAVLKSGQAHWGDPTKRIDEVFFHLPLALPFGGNFNFMQMIFFAPPTQEVSVFELQNTLRTEKAAIGGAALATSTIAKRRERRPGPKVSAVALAAHLFSW